MPIANGVMTIAPADIKITDHLWGAFGHYETEISADWLVRFAQERGSWEPFTYADIEAFYSKSGKLRGFIFNKLVSGGFITEVKAGSIGAKKVTFVAYTEDVYHFTEEFISRCYKAANKV